MAKDKLRGKELMEREEQLAHYEGRDKIVSSHELAEELSKTEESVFKVGTGIKSLDRILGDGVEAGELIVVTGPTGEGKCLGKGTRVRMFDGSVKAVEKVRVGDQLMGPDSNPRDVLALGRGKEMMYQVCQTKGMWFQANGDHVLVLRRTDTGRVIEISINDYLKISRTQKHLLKGFSVAVDYPESPLSIEPYFLGLWLGDGHSDSTRITTADEEIVEYLQDFAIRLGLALAKYEMKNNKANLYSLTNKWRNHLLKEMKLLKVMGNKHIPTQYLINNRENRLELLAGLLDSDGYVNHGGYVFVNKNERLARDVQEIARSLGMRCYLKKFKNEQFGKYYWKVGISGDCSIIPLKIPRKKVEKRKQIKDVANKGISVWEHGEGEYYGFQIDGDGRFLLEDFTVTHNTTLLMSITKNMAEVGTNSVWFTLEVTPRQFLQKLIKASGEAATLPLFYLPHAGVDEADDKYVREW